MEELSAGTVETLCLLERAWSGEVILSWVFPAVDAGMEQALLARCAAVLPLQADAHTDSPAPFFFTSFQRQWQYVRCCELQDASPTPTFRTADCASASTVKSPPTPPRPVTLPACASLSARCSGFALCVCSKVTDFRPEMYEKITLLLAQLFAHTDNTLDLLSIFFDLQSTGTTTIQATPTAAVSVSMAEWDPRIALIHTPLSALVRVLGGAIVHLWSALLLKKRVAVVARSAPVLCALLRAFPLLVWHRRDWSVLRPFVCLTAVELDDLRAGGFYVAGFTDTAVKGREDLFDVLVDLDSGSVTPTATASKDLPTGNFHREIGKFLLDGVQSGEEDHVLIKGVAGLTRQVIARLDSLAEGGVVSMRALQQRRLPPNMDRFLYLAAAAEGRARPSR